jgi:asparagine synthase (glutamine-hydrolysing)
MCGFLGQFDTGTKQLDANVLKELLTLSIERGPDESKSWLNKDENVWLGFNRLAIQELSAAGSQPMHSNNERYAMVFNGEIYNHPNLRKQLPERAWRGHSDTETILACVEHWGFEKTIAQLDGMFAIALYDHLENTLYAARDFAGIKPFFYGWNGHSLVFASQYNQVKNHPLFKNNATDPAVLRLYLEQHHVPAPFGIIQQTGQLRPGEWMKIGNGKLEKKRYWEFPAYQEAQIYNENEALDHIEQALYKAVQNQLISDVPLGGFLSGGIDSPLVCYFASRNNEGRFPTFSIGSNSRIHDESDDAMAYAKWINSNATLNKMSAESMQEYLPEVLKHLHEPLGDFSLLPTYLVSKLAREKVTVALSGDGGDELFFGYERFGSVAKNIAFQHYPYWLKALIYKGDQYAFKSKFVNSGVLHAQQAIGHRKLHNRFSNYWIQTLFPDLAHIQTPETYDVYNFPNVRNENELIQHMRKAEFYGMMQKTLRKVDIASMAVSLEVRVPFLSKQLIEASLQVDSFLSYGHGKKKELLKKLLKSKFPQAPIDDKKRGFTVPLGHWLKTKDYAHTVEQTILNAAAHNDYGLSKKGLKQLFEQHQKGTDLKWPIFTVMALQ